MKHLIILLFTLLLSTYTNCQTVWLDADTGNEMDDLYAIARLVKEPGLKIAGLSSAHFNNPDLLVFEKWNAYDSKGLNTVDESQKLNEQILKSLGRSEIPHPKGADRQIGRAWGGRDPRDSPAARSIIEAVSSLPEGQKLDIITIGAVTNVVSAIIIAPEIISKIRCFTLGASYKPETGVWNKNEFNVRNDLNAFDYLLDCVGLDLTIMPLEAALPMQFDRDETYKKLNDKTGIQLILKERWIEHYPQDKTRIMWDLALVEAYLNPSLAKTATVNNPPENRQRAIKVYTGIDEKNLADDFWNTLKNK
jgi:inosine-uridine nucleoside N-ribohydrolase